MKNNYLKPEAQFIKVEAEESIMVGGLGTINDYVGGSFGVGDSEEEGI